ncbi:hypothetical protein Bca101_010188 [Brassica carinata]
MANLETPNSEGNTTHPPQELNGSRGTQTYNIEDSDSEPETIMEAPEGTKTARYSITSYLEQVFSRKFSAIQSRVERLPGVASPIRKSDPDSYADTPFSDEIALIEMPRKSPCPA